MHPVGAHLRHDNGAPYGCPICAPTGCTLFIFISRTSTRLRLVPGSNAPLGCIWVPLRGTHYKHACEQGNIYFGQNYRDLGQIVRVTFDKIMGYPIGHPIWAPYRVPISRLHFVNYCPFGAGSRHHGGAHICSVPLRDYFSLRAPPGPLMGTLSGTHVGTPTGPPLFKTKIILSPTPAHKEAHSSQLQTHPHIHTWFAFILP